MLGDGVEAARVEGMAAHQTPQGQIHPSGETVSQERLASVNGAGRLEPTGGRQPGRDCPLVEVEDRYDESVQALTGAVSARPLARGRVDSHGKAPRTSRKPRRVGC